MALCVYAQRPTLPEDGSFVAGADGIGTALNGSLAIKQTSGRGIIDWNSFSLGIGGHVGRKPNRPDLRNRYQND